MTRFLAVCLVAASIASLCRPAICNDVGAGESQPIGNWTGQSICQVPGSACQDEQVVYHITKGGDADHVRVSADKIVSGKTINMGAAEYAYSSHDSTLVNETAGRVWKLTIRGKSIEGTLTMHDKTIYRRLTLVKE